MDTIVRRSATQASLILVSLAPLFAFWFISLGGSWVQFEVAVLVGIGLLVGLAVARLARGTLLWASIVFFGIAAIFGVGLRDPWTLAHLGLFPTTIFLLAILGSMLVGRPFIAEYAREEVSPEEQESVGFLRRCYVLTSFWALVMLLMMGVGVLQMYHPGPGPLGYALIQLGIIGVALVGQTMFVVRIRRRRTLPSLVVPPAG